VREGTGYHRNDLLARTRDRATRENCHFIESEARRYLSRVLEQVGKSGKIRKIPVANDLKEQTPLAVFDHPFYPSAIRPALRNNPQTHSPFSSSFRARARAHGDISAFRRAQRRRGLIFISEDTRAAKMTPSSRERDGARRKERRGGRGCL